MRQNLTFFYSCRAFSLLEILVVLTVLAVLVALSLPTYTSVSRRTESIRCAANLRQLHTATMLFFADQHFFPIGYSDDYVPGVGPMQRPGTRWSRIRRHEYSPTLADTGLYTHWQIEIAPYLGNGLVEQANQHVYPNPQRKDAHTAWDGLGEDPSAWRLPMELRCPAYNRKLSDPKFKWQHATGDVYNDHYGYCYNQHVLVGTGSPEANYNTGEEQHKGRDPRTMTPGYAPPNAAGSTLLLFCSRWGVWQAKTGTVAADLSGIFASPATSGFPGYPLTDPHGHPGDYSGVAAAVHNGYDNFVFLDGHIESLSRNVGKDRRRMNKAWWRPLPLDASYGHYYRNGPGDYHVAYLFNDEGQPFGHLYTDGSSLGWWIRDEVKPSWWTGTPASSGYSWDF